MSMDLDSHSNVAESDTEVLEDVLLAGKLQCVAQTTNLYSGQRNSPLHNN